MTGGMQRMVKNEKTGEQELAKGAGPSTNILLVMSGKGVKVPAVENAKFSKDFMSSKKMRPILFSHGDKSTANMLAGTMIDFASRGYACFAPLHTDGSCLYTEKKNGKSVNLEKFCLKWEKDKWTEK